MAAAEGFNAGIRIREREKESSRRSQRTSDARSLNVELRVSKRAVVAVGAICRVGVSCLCVVVCGCVCIAARTNERTGLRGPS